MSIRRSVFCFAGALGFFALSAGDLMAAPLHDISTATGLFVPSFRGVSANTTWFGWGSGSFDGATEDDRIDNPVITIGTAAPGVSLTQVDPAQDIVSSTNNIYTGQGPNSQTADLTLVIPTAGVTDSGFTTIIIQGLTLPPGGPSNPDTLIQNHPIFGDITVGSDTYSPEFTIASNATGTGQWFVKYVIEGSTPTYTVDIHLPGGLGSEGFLPISISELVVDTVWSDQAAGDTVVVPEPASFGLLGLAGAAMVLRRRRNA
jgi:hypothetical protein